jgi:hypothetical protein
MNGDPYADTFPTERGCEPGITGVDSTQIQDEELTDAQIEKLDENDNLIITLIQDFLGVPCDYVDDDMCDIVHTIGDMISTWGEQKKGVPEVESYPYIIRVVEGCKHLDVTEYVRTWPATRFEPAEYEGYAVCNNCGETLDLFEIPDGCVVTEGNDECPINLKKGQPEE